MLPATKETPKEMLPLFHRAEGFVSLSPCVQILFEQLHRFGISDFVFVTGRGKRSIEDHFTPDYSYVRYLRDRGKEREARHLEAFYHMIESSQIFWTFQPEPRGFGHAVSLARPYIGDEPFFVLAGDTYILSKDEHYLKRIVGCHTKYRPKACLLVFEVDNPRMYGVTEVKPLEAGVFKVTRVIEKPEKPPSNLAILPVYIFDPLIFRALERVEPDKRGEIQLTNGIQNLIEWGFDVLAVKLREEEYRLDIGRPDFYAEALVLSMLNCGVDVNELLQRIPSAV
jgi:UTP--glucose-1-phosphate uridylyltransferase